MARPGRPFAGSPWSAMPVPVFAPEAVTIPLGDTQFGAARGAWRRCLYREGELLHRFPLEKAP
jgi:hypothetical protein